MFAYFEESGSSLFVDIVEVLKMGTEGQSYGGDPGGKRQMDGTGSRSEVSEILLSGGRERLGLYKKCRTHPPQISDIVHLKRINIFIKSIFENTYMIGLLLFSHIYSSYWYLDFQAYP